MPAGIQTIRQRDTTAETFSEVLCEKIKEAGNWGVVHIEAGTYDTFHPIHLPDVRVTIRGLGMWKPTIRLRRRGIKFAAPGLINVGCNGTKIELLKIVCKDFPHSWEHSISSCAINTNGYRDVEVENVEIRDAGIGVGTADNRQGKIPHGLTITRSIFIDCKHGVHWNRVMSVNKVNWGVKKIRILDCKFYGKQDAGISIDCGNDGLDGNPNLGRLRSRLGMNTVTNMDDMVIKGCLFARALKYNVALAKVWNVNIINNHFEGATIQHGESVNIEHSSHDITVEGNKFTGGVRGREQSHISILTFRDTYNGGRDFFGRDPDSFFPGDGCQNIRIRLNEFLGSPQNFVYGEYARNIIVQGNRTNMFRNVYNNCSIEVGCTDIRIQGAPVISNRTLLVCCGRQYG